MEVNYETSELTALCPMTGLPDFYNLKMKDTYLFARASGIPVYLIATPTNAASAVESVNAFGILATELPYAYKSKAFHLARGTAFNHLEQHTQSKDENTARHAREALQKLAVMLG